jgi:hypothetical protein
MRNEPRGNFQFLAKTQPAAHPGPLSRFELGEEERFFARAARAGPGDRLSFV